MGSHNPPSFRGLSVLVGIRFPLQLMWDLTIHLSSGSRILVDTRSSLQLMCDLTIHLHLTPSPASSLTLIPLSNQYGISQSTPFRDPTSSLTLVLLQSMWDLRIHSLRDPTSSLTLVLLQSMWDLKIHPPSGPNISFLSLIDVRSHNPLPSRPTSSLTLVPLSN